MPKHSINSRNISFTPARKESNIGNIIGTTFAMIVLLSAGFSVMILSLISGI